MLHTRVCSLFGIEHPVLLGPMGSATGAALAAAVSNAGGLGTVGCVGRTPDWIAQTAREIREKTDRPFGLNLILFDADEQALDAIFDARPPVFSSAWAWPEQDLRGLFSRAHGLDARVVHMVSGVPEACRAAEAGADAIIAQGTEGGGHVGLMGTMALVPQVVRAVAPLPVLAAGGIATGEGLAAALALGAEGVLVGTRFLATPEAPVADGFKQAILASDGHDTVLTEIPDIARGRVWPGAYSRVVRNRLIETWAGREGELRARRAEVGPAMVRAFQAGDADGAPLFIGQDAGMIDAIVPAAEIVRRMVADAEAALRRAAAPLS
ncbi:MAG TPA: nitronate monooxygenase family protein [Thermoanaerobaculia bacterium]|nr:nitronate monooxygenase family protein [Thermoanaerobaculia bacterium]